MGTMGSQAAKEMGNEPNGKYLVLGNLLNTSKNTSKCIYMFIHFKSLNSKRPSSSWWLSCAQFETARCDWVAEWAWWVAPPTRDTWGLLQVWLIYIYINEIYNYTIIPMCMYVYIYISIYISRKQICWDPFCIFRTMLLDWPYLVGKRPPNGIGSLTEECSEKLIIISTTKCRLTYDWVIAVVVIYGVIHSKNGVISTYNC